LHAGRLVDHETGDDLGPVGAVELVTVGQRRGMGHGRDGRRRFVTAVDVPTRRVTLGPPEAAHTAEVVLHTVTWVDGFPGAGVGTGDDAGVEAIAQCSAHGTPVPSRVYRCDDGLRVAFATPQRRIAPGQTVALYDRDRPAVVMGSGIAA
jgi:tRNA-specific 2-thiouridylase